MIKKGCLSIKSINVEGKGAIILTGPSGCGKGEIARYLVNMFMLDEKFHLSMGEILRSLIEKARNDKDFLEILHSKYGISYKVSIFTPEYNSASVISKAEQHKSNIENMIKNDDFFPNKKEITQFAWLCYAVANGLLVPKEWTNKILEATFENNYDLRNALFLLDGYPRTTAAARHMIDLFDRLNIPIIKVIHLSITKTEMIRRTQLRNRNDDNMAALENRFQFYIEQVQPSVDEIKKILGCDSVSLIDAHQPVIEENGELNVLNSIEKVAKNVISSLNITF